MKSLNFFFLKMNISIYADLSVTKVQKLPFTMWKIEVLQKGVSPFVKNVPKMTVGKRKIFRKVVHNKCIYVHDKIIGYKTLYKNQQAMYKIISLSLWQQILATTISNHNTCDRSSSHGRACSGTPWGQLRETGLCIPISLY